MSLCASDTANCFLSQKQLPGTLKEIQSQGTVVPLGNNIAALALAGVQWENALISTRNDAVIIAGIGGYGRYQSTACTFNVTHSEHRLDIRVNAESGPNLSRILSGNGLFSSAFSTDDAELIQHRVQVDTLRDHAILSMIETIPHTEITQKPTISDILHLSTVRRAIESWDDSDPGSHLNDMVLDEGRTRLQCLPHVGKGRAWQVASYPLCSFLTFLCDRKISFIRGVVAKGILQLDRGPLVMDHTSNGLMFMQGGSRSFSIDTKKIYQLWVTAFGQHWQLELYSRDGKALAIFAADPFYPKDHWRDLLNALPPVVNR